jgi:hypothetical protein
VRNKTKDETYPVHGTHDHCVLLELGAGRVVFTLRVGAEQKLVEPRPAVFGLLSHRKPEVNRSSVGLAERTHDSNYRTYSTADRMDSTCLKLMADSDAENTRSSCTNLDQRDLWRWDC